MHSIGETARASGLSVSALRFYDGAGVLVPALVDPENGYRWYADRQIHQARLVAGLRRVGLPVAEIAEVLAGDRDDAHRLLDRHLHRLETGLADARRELSRVHALLDTQETPMTTVTLAQTGLASAVRAVRFAAGATTDTELPMLAGVLLDVDSDAVTFVATDRYRMAIHREPAAVDGLPVRAIAPLAWIDRLSTQHGDAPITLTVTDTAIEATGNGWTIKDKPLPYDYTDWRRAVESRTAGGQPRRTRVDPAELRAALTTTPPVIRHDHELVVLTIGAEGGIDVGGEQEWEAGAIAVNREFLLQALAAGGDGQLVLELDGPIRPLAIRRPADDRAYSLLMPVKP
ncbi:MerR family transcriptional regulator [Asanoa sp. WMMD1127]|uniref:DNA polymerase III subunit beta family protein n=1 Tax=Asanoa sp. WMMD1127 TaxID=3016107 RepID=UPI0024180C19|nr:MerR family transcriptional regulator [Asanoa sp. WMMD1127]MDG4821720.1 MerR family transcriptional regulator [Asanoa sp. WMMD1127]